LVALLVKIYIWLVLRNCRSSTVFNSTSAQGAAAQSQYVRITTMNTTLRVACLSAVLLALMLPLAAQTAPNAVQSSPTPPIPKPPTINQRLENQQDRIAQGIKSGQLSAGEAANLETKEGAITNEVKADRQANGGKLTQAERAQVNHQLNHTSRQIYRDKHNGVRGPH
jgi:hypothetical protein